MRKLHAETALLPTGWKRDVEIAIGDDGRIASVMENVPRSPDTETVPILLPALANVHSHAFQRALAGLTERRGPGRDDFWSWREVMFVFLERLGPEELKDVAAMLFVELMESGFASVAEFHYVHNAPDGSKYSNPAETGAGIAAAAHGTGIGLTHLPVYYAQGDFGGAPPGDGQRRFLNDPDGFARIVDSMPQYLTRADDRLGIAPHSLRAVTPEHLSAILSNDPGGPIHIHIAEQTKEVDACLAWSGQRPVEWLLDHVGPDSRWCHIHATHMTEDEAVRLARTGGVAGLCPSTEADLGDGIFQFHAFTEAGGALGIGTDSHVGTDAAQELRLMEWAQRLTHRTRNIAAPPNGSTGRTLFDATLAGGAQALGRACGAIAPGNWADLVSLDDHHPTITGKSGNDILDSWIFAGDRSCVSQVWSAGRHCVKDGIHKDREAVAARYRSVMAKLLA